MRIATIGAGYVGLVTGACLAELGHHVICVDRDATRIAGLCNGVVPIYEPGLDELIIRNTQAGRIVFSDDLLRSVTDRDAVFIAVGTPSDPKTGHADLSFVRTVAIELGRSIGPETVVVTKSTVPVGTNRLVHSLISAAPGLAGMTVASNPEFLREGSAIADFMEPDRIVIGADSARAIEVMRAIYEPLTRRGRPLIACDLESAEVIKYAANAFLAVMTAEQKGTFACLTVTWLFALAGFWTWWLEREHIAGVGRYFFNTALVLWATLSPGYFVMIFWRSHVADDLPALPANWRVAMVVTKAPSEPFEVLQETLEAMLRQNWPHDTWLADEDPSLGTFDWCRHHGVRLSTRRGIASYHRPSWPRRTRCKEGNLAYFYDHYGYHLYDFVIQLDADHVPAENYLIEMLKPFRDHRVGYVSAPSICDRNADTSWSARGRLHVEGGLHGALQAGHNGGLAPLCIGSHYAVRTRALREIGGIGPELAEDHSTTLMMNSHGWRGVHALNAIANGAGPPTFADMVTQEFQWARSLAVILFRYTRENWGGLSPRMKGQFLFSQLWYAIFSIFMAFSVIAPITALLTRHTWVAVLYPTFLLHSALVTLTIIGLMAWVRRNGWFRPRSAKVLSWEGALFTFARWPWSLLGVFTGAYAGMTRRDLSFHVTPKGGDAAAAVPARVILPYLAISLACALPVLLIDEPGSATGFYVMSLLNALIYLVIVGVVLIMHRRENPVLRANRRCFGVRKSAVVNGFGAVCAAMVLAAATWLHVSPGIAALAMLEPSGLQDRQTAASGTGKPMFNFGVYDPQRQLAAASNIAVEHVFVSWADADAARQIEASIRSVSASGRWLLLTIEPWAAPGMARDRLVSDVAEGHYDGRIDELCRRVGLNERIGRGKTNLFVRWGHEMDQPGFRYPWQGTNGSAFVAAYRHFVTRCRAALASTQDVYFVWSPVGGSNLARYYPGSAYVDWIGLSVYDCVSCGRGIDAPSGSFAEIVQAKYRRVHSYGKPVMVAEMGVDGADQREWLADALKASCALPQLRLLVYFNAIDSPGVWGRSRPDWHLRPETLAAVETADTKAMCPGTQHGLE